MFAGGSSVKQIEQNCALSEEGPLPDEVLTALDQAYKIVQAWQPTYWR